MLNPNQVAELVEIIQSQHLLFVVQHIGADVLSDADKANLKSFGIDIDQLQVQPLTFETAFKFGILSSALTKAAAQVMTYDTLKRKMLSNTFLPLSSNELRALQALKMQAYSEIRGLGNRISNDLNTIAIEVDRAQRLKYEKLIQDQAYETISNRDSIQKMISELGHKTNDWNRDFGRISDFILHNAFDEGRAYGFARNGYQKVYKDVFPGGCNHCIRLYTKDGFVGSEPIIYTLGELRANGTNIGRKTAEWKPVIGATHPWCRCTLNYVPDGYEWNPSTRDFDIPKKDEKSPIERKSKVKVQVGEKIHFA